MLILIVGLGSMGRRRIRNLRELGMSAPVGFDLREDRRQSAAAEYGIATVGSLESLEERPDVVIVSTSPQSHLPALEWAASIGAHAFVEASVSGREEARRMRQIATASPTVMVPSCTMRYFRGPARVRDLVASGAVGRPLLLTHHVGQWLPDWHPWESIDSYYVSNRETGGAREIVPFEFTWLNEVFGQPRAVSCRRGRISDLPADIDDHYHSVVEYPGGMTAAVTIEVLSRPVATREFRLVGTEGVLRFSGQRGLLEMETTGSGEIILAEDLSQGSAAPGYIYPETPYVDEMRDFLGSVAAGEPARFPNDFERDERVLALLNDLEDMSR
ncbi:MAG: Gfo/Idh/MocA family oxidoreductase [Actinomycetota bacterium]|nr:Gfo/Idh/MocA family oxidoreductase [Actinomycetota bacterium]